VQLAIPSKPCNTKEKKARCNALGFLPLLIERHGQSHPPSSPRNLGCNASGLLALEQEAQPTTFSDLCSKQNNQKRKPRAFPFWVFFFFEQRWNKKASKRKEKAHI
jgi:hypothetical protein